MYEGVDIALWAYAELSAATCRSAAIQTINYLIRRFAEVALSFGFAELGRFSVEYREAFGESPWATLRRARKSASLISPRGRKPGATATNNFAI
jgi:hypothetical protein